MGNCSRHANDKVLMLKQLYFVLNDVIHISIQL